MNTVYFSVFSIGAWVTPGGGGFAALNELVLRTMMPSPPWGDLHVVPQQPLPRGSPV